MSDEVQLKRDEEILAKYVENFRRKWKPADDYDQREFEVELYAILSLTTRVAQAPLIKQMSAALSLVPPGPIFIETNKLKPSS